VTVVGSEACTANAIELDEQLLLQFVIWNLRVRDLPHAVSQAARRVAAARRHPRPFAIEEKYLDAPYRVSALPVDENDQGVHLSTDVESVVPTVAELLLTRPQHIIVTDLLTPSGGDS
jgi:hypothetical protein